MLDFLQAVKQHIRGEAGPEEERRADICAKCPLKEVKLYAHIFDSKMEEINGYVCVECGCPIATKIFAKDEKNICHKWRQ